MVDLNGITDLVDLYAAWDGDPGSVDLANQVLFGCHEDVFGQLPAGCPGERDGVHDVLLDLLGAFTGVQHLVLVGGDPIIPFARMPERTALLPEACYPSPESAACSVLSQATDI